MFTLVQQFELSLLLLLALLLSALLGADRERRDKDAGLRTHMLVGLGSCLLAIASENAFTGGDPSRIAASAISGISFLGAGVIIVRQNRVHDLTTAASIWVAAAIGVMVGGGGWLIAILATLMAWFTLFVLHRFEQRVYKKDQEDDEET